MQREMSDPSEALPVIVTEFIRPMMDEIDRHRGTARARARPPPRSTRCAFSIVGQALFYRFAMPAVLRMLGERRYPPALTAPLAEHIAAFSPGRPRRGRDARRTEAACALTRAPRGLPGPGARPGDGLRAGARAHATRGRRRLERRSGAATSWRRARPPPRVALDPEAPPPEPRARRRAAVARRRARARDRRATGASPRPTASVDAAAARVRDARGRLLPATTGAGRYTWYTDPRSATPSRCRPALLPPARRSPSFVIREQQSGTSERRHRRPARRDRRAPADAHRGAGRLPRRARARLGDDARRRRSASSAPTSTCSRRERLREVVEQTIALDRAQLANAQQRFDAGRLTKNELLVVQVALPGRASRSCVQRDLDDRPGALALNEAIGARSTRRRRSSTWPTVPTLPPVDDALRDAFANNPVLALAGRGAAAPGRDRDRARARPPAALRGRRRGRLDERRRSSSRSAIGSGFVGFTWDLGTDGRREAQHRRSAHRGRAQPPRASSASCASSRAPCATRARRRRAPRRARHGARRRRAGRGEPAHPPAAVRRRPRHERGRARRRGAARAAARDARHRALPGAHPPRRAAAADGPAARRARRTPRGSRRMASASRSSSPCSPSSRRAVWWLRREHGPVHYTGFVEGEERVHPQRGRRARARGAVRARATGARRAPWSRGSTIATSPRRSPRKRAEIGVLDAEIRRQEEQVALTESTWQRDRSARRGRGARRRRPARERAERTFAREQELVADRRQHRAAARRHARGARPGARARSSARARCSARTEAEERSIAARAPAAATSCAQQRELRAARARRARGDAGQVRHPRARRRHRRADAVHLAGRAGAAGHAIVSRARSARQVRAGLRAGRRRRSRSASAARSRSSSTASRAAASRAR